MNDVNDDIAMVDIVMVDAQPTTNEDADMRNMDADDHMSVM